MKVILSENAKELGIKAAKATADLINRANENGGNDNITVLLGKKEKGRKQDT